MRWVAAIAIGLAVCAGAAAAPSSYPRPLRACGSIVVGTKRLAVDIPEADPTAKLPSCALARGTMRRYLLRARRRHWRKGSGRNITLTYNRERFSCYTARPDGVGWSYHCTRMSSRYFDLAAGRRGRLCPLPYAQSRRCPPN